MLPHQFQNTICAPINPHWYNALLAISKLKKTQIQGRFTTWRPARDSHRVAARQYLSCHGNGSTGIWYYLEVHRNFVALRSLDEITSSVEGEGFWSSQQNPSRHLCMFLSNVKQMEKLINRYLRIIQTKKCYVTRLCFYRGECKVVRYVQTPSLRPRRHGIRIARGQTRRELCPARWQEWLPLNIILLLFLTHNFPVYITIDSQRLNWGE